MCFVTWVRNDMWMCLVTCGCVGVVTCGCVMDVCVCVVIAAGMQYLCHVCCDM